MTVDVYPDNWERAADALTDPAAVVVAGGTSVQPWLTTSGATPSALVHLRAVREAWAVEPEAEKLRLGAMVAVDDPALVDWFGSEGAGWFATPAVRRRATVVGNVVSRLGPRELGPVLVACGSRLRVMTAAGEMCWLPVDQIVQQGIRLDALVMQLDTHRPERISYHRVSPRARLSRVQIGLCAAVGPGCGAALVVQAGGPAFRVLDGVPTRCADFVAAVREKVADGTIPGAGEQDLQIVTALAQRVYRDVHGGSR